MPIVLPKRIAFRRVPFRKAIVVMALGWQSREVCAKDPMPNNAGLYCLVNLFDGYLYLFDHVLR
jgi:hypothetical protein